MPNATVLFDVWFSITVSQYTIKDLEMPPASSKGRRKNIYDVKPRSVIPKGLCVDL